MPEKSKYTNATWETKGNTKILYLPKNNYHKPIISKDSVCWKVVVMNRAVERELVEE